jgi:hypothetical protein
VPIDTTVPGSPGWWFSRLMRELGERRPRLDRLNRYYTGDPDLPEGAENCRPAYRQFQQRARVNFAELVVEAVRERMVPTGFRTGAKGDALGDDNAWRIWQANQLDADAMMVHRAMLSMGDAFVVVGPGPNGPVITPEDPRQVWSVLDPVTRRPLAAIKVATNEWETVDVAYLYLPGYVVRAARVHPAGSHVPFDVGSWEWVGEVQPTGLPVVPVVRFANRRDLAGCSLGEFEDHMDTLDRINFVILQRLVITAVQAFKQRAVKGNLPVTDAAGNEIDYSSLFRADPGALWQLPEGVDIWESGQVDLGGILQAVRHDIQDLAAVTRTPLFYLTPDATNGSAEGASLAREGLVFKTADRIVQTGESWEQVMALAFAFAGDTERASRQDMEVLWAAPERFSLAERYDAAAKAQAAGVPWRTVMSSVLQFSPQEIERMEAERTMDALLRDASAVQPLTV